jgi:DNA-binding NarL/FixJ family response regulator
VADGLTDRAIGGRLFISHRTVERHVSNLLSKLEVGRRAELVATAHRDGLLAPPDDSSAG